MSEALEQARAALLRDGWCALHGVLDPDETRVALDRLWAAAEAYRARGNDTHIAYLDPNAANVRVFDLLDLDPLFRELIVRPEALELVTALLGPRFLVSNFTANIARPGSGSMNLHSDQALVVPGPWLEPWSINIIWCLTDLRFENGATLYIPGSHRVTRLEDLGDNPGARLTAFEAPAGSIVAMDGRMWHTSGANITRDEDRALLFGYYSRDFLRPQVNWNAVLSEATMRDLDPALHRRLGLERNANLGTGVEILAADLGRT